MLYHLLTNECLRSATFVPVMESADLIAFLRGVEAEGLARSTTIASAAARSASRGDGCSCPIRRRHSLSSRWLIAS